MPHANRPGDQLGGRYTLVDLLNESRGGRFWRARDQVLSRHVAIHVIPADDDRAAGLLDAARRSAGVQDRRLLRVLDADELDGVVFVVNEWGIGTSLDVLLAEGPLSPRRAAWIVSEVADALASAHAADVPHGHLTPEDVLVDHVGSVRVIGHAVDAALRGVPRTRPQDDVVDLVALLYAALTGRWAGRSASMVEAAPVEAGRVLRPRQVRAGIPRVLDQLCDRVLHPSDPAGEGAGEPAPPDAAEVTALLHEFVGDPLEMAAAEAARNHAPPPQVELVDGDPGTTSPSPATPEDGIGPVAEPEAMAGPPAEPPADPPADPVAADPGPTARAPAPDEAGRGDQDRGQDQDQDQPTQAGLPIFSDDTSEVEWRQVQPDRPPPPPPFEEPPERPLFAPEPSGGHPQRRAAPAAAGPGRPDDPYWPWDTDAGRGPAATGAGAGAVITEETGELERVPGRSWLRLAMLVGVAALVLAAVAFTTDLLRGGQPLGVGPPPDDEQSPSASASASPEEQPPRPVTQLDASAYDPQSDDGEENDEDAPNAVDGQPGTTWRTSTYLQQLGPAGLKTGVGLAIDLGEATAVREVDLRLQGAPTEGQLYLTDEVPESVAELDPAAEIAATGPNTSIKLDGEAEGRYLVVWLTSLPQVDGGFRAEVTEVVVRA